MATLSWTKLSPTVEIHPTTKKFYDQYLFKIALCCPAGRIILNTKLSISTLLQHRAERDKRFYSWGGVWARNPIGRYTTEDAQVAQIQYYQQVRARHREEIKLRVEEPNVSIYSNDAQLLYNIASGDPRNGACPLRAVHLPINDDARELLDNGNILSNAKNPYKYKVLMRLNDIPAESKLQISNYLDSLGDDVRVTAGCRKILLDEQKWGGAYFYSMDNSMIMFINLISPDAVVGFYPLAHLVTK